MHFHRSDAFAQHGNFPCVRFCLTTLMHLRLKRLNYSKRDAEIADSGGLDRRSTPRATAQHKELQQSISEQRSDLHSKA
jgi:hypothetical protein